MAAPTITSVTTPTSNNGSVSNGGSTATITGTGLTGTKKVLFGNNEASNIVVVSATEVTCTVPPNTVQFRGENTAGYVNVVATTAEGSSAVENANVFVYWDPNKAVTIKVDEDNFRVNEKVPVGKVKGGSAAEPVSYLKQAGAGEVAIPLTGNYTGLYTDFLVLEVNVQEVTGTPKLVVVLEHTIDNGTTWAPLPTTLTTTEQTGVSVVKVEASEKEKPYGTQLRLNFKFGAAGGVAGYAQVITDHA